MALHPAYTNASVDPFKRKLDVQIPIFFGAGSSDWITWNASVHNAYHKVKSGVPKAFAEIKGANHHEPTTGANRWMPYVISMFDCHINDKQSDCENIYGTSTYEPCSLCTCPGTIPMKHCEHENEPTGI